VGDTTLMAKPKPDAIAFHAQLADGRTCLGTDRDGEGRLTLLLSAEDTAAVITRLDELREGFYCTLVPLAQVRN